MKFGLWFEPECISENSDLFRAHPEWVLNAPARPGALGRKQWVLDMANSDVVDAIFGYMVLLFYAILPLLLLLPLQCSTIACGRFAAVCGRQCGCGGTYTQWCRALAFCRYKHNGDIRPFYNRCIAFCVNSSFIANAAGCPFRRAGACDATIDKSFNN